MDKTKYGYETADPMYYELLKRFAIRQRKYPTEAESIMWGILSNNFLHSHFRRQHIIGDYIADFVCLKSNLIIEIDGGYHLEDYQIIKDASRTKWLNEHGFKVIRFTNDEVIANTRRVIEVITNNI